MPFDNTGYRVLTEQQEADLALLRKVRDAIGKRNSWIKNARTDNQGRHCISGWIDVFDHGREIAMMELISPFVRGVNIPVMEVNARNRVIAFNDRKSTRKIAVVRLLDRVIASIEGKPNG